MFLEKAQNKNRNRSYNRFQRERVIKRKQYILKNILHCEDTYFTSKRIGQLFKGKVHCSCQMCKFEKHYGIEKHKYKDR